MAAGLESAKKRVREDGSGAKGEERRTRVWTTLDGKGREAIEAEAKEILGGEGGAGGRLHGLLCDVASLVEEYWPEEAQCAPSVLLGRFAEVVTKDALRRGEVNPVVSTVPARLGDVVFAAMECMRKLELYIRLRVPPVEDGNNFGVDVQASVMDYVVQSRSSLSHYLDSLKEYHWIRGNAMEKFGVETSEETSKVDSGAQTKKSGTKGYSQIDDFVRYVLTLDTRYFLQFRNMSMDIHDMILQCLDLVGKNRDKMEHPRGGEEARHNMY